jgi:hypothetical protein
VYWRKQDSEKARSFLDLARKNQLPINMLSRPERELLKLCDRDLNAETSRDTGP